MSGGPMHDPLSDYQTLGSMKDGKVVNHLASLGTAANAQIAFARARGALIVWLLLLTQYATRAIVFNGTDYPVPTDGVTDAQPGLKAYFAAVAAATGNKSVTLPAGKYLIGLASTANQISLPSNTTIDASLAQFVFPTNLPTSNSAYPFPLAFATVDATNLI